MGPTLDLNDREREKGNDESKSVCCYVGGLAFTKLNADGIIIDICDIMNDDCDNLEIETQIKLSLIDRNKL